MLLHGLLPVDVACCMLNVSCKRDCSLSLSLFFCIFTILTGISNGTTINRNTGKISHSVLHCFLFSTLPYIYVCICSCDTSELQEIKISFMVSLTWLFSPYEQHMVHNFLRIHICTCFPDDTLG